MLKGLVITPPVIGRISIGKVVEKNGKRLPEKDDEFTITSQVQSRDGWKPHPMDDTLRHEAKTNASFKLRAIPIKLLFNDPDLNLRSSYSLFDRNSGRPMCVGDGETCRRVTPTGMQSFPCPSPAACALGVERGCKPYGRLNVRIGDEDELGSFVFRTTGFNSIRTLTARLRYFAAISGGLLANLPLELRLRGKSTTMSHGTPIYYADLILRNGITMAKAISGARSESEARKVAGFDQAALDEAARQGFALGAFEDSEEEGSAVVEEFFPEEETPPQTHASNASGFNPSSATTATGATVAGHTRSRLADKLHRKLGVPHGPAGEP